MLALTNTNRRAASRPVGCCHTTVRPTMRRLRPCHAAVTALYDRAVYRRDIRDGAVRDRFGGMRMRWTGWLLFLIGAPLLGGMLAIVDVVVGLQGAAVIVFVGLCTVALFAIAVTAANWLVHGLLHRVAVRQ